MTPTRKPEICAVCHTADEDCLLNLETGKWNCPRCDGRIPPLTATEQAAMEAPSEPRKVEWFTLEDSSGCLRVIDALTKVQVEAMNRKQRRVFCATRLKNFPKLPVHLAPAFSKKKKYLQELTDRDCPTCGAYKLTRWGNTEKGIPFHTCPVCGIVEEAIEAPGT